jgi:hypothetical protein
MQLAEAIANRPRDAQRRTGRHSVCSPVARTMTTSLTCFTNSVAMRIGKPPRTT